MANKHLGSSVDDFLKEEGVLEEFQASAIKEVAMWQLAEAKKSALNTSFSATSPHGGPCGYGVEW